MIIYSDDIITFEVSEAYYMIRVGNRTWYWIKETGKFDGTSYKVDS
jgi:hypothetical protein